MAVPNKLATINQANQYPLSFNGVNYDLKYNASDGTVVLIDTNASQNTQPIYKDGKWTTQGNALNIPEATKNQVHSAIIDKVKTSHTTAGGNSQKAVLPQWIQTNSASNATSTTPASNPSNSQNGQGSGTNSGNNPANSGGGFLNVTGNINNFSVDGNKFGVNNVKELFGAPLIYPEDLDDVNQDTFQITQYRYKPSKKEALFSKDLTTLNSGIQRGANFNKEQIIGTVTLPMPSKVADANAVSWGEDTMNNLSAAMTANTLNNIVPTALAAGGSTLLGAGGGSGVVIANLIDILRKGGMSDELQLLGGTTIASKLLKMGGFGVEAESILARGAGIIPNSNLDLLFNGPTLRSFQFSYRLSPRSSNEAQKVRRIIRFFKQGMAAKKMSGKSGQASFFLGTPNIFKLEYRTNKTQHIAGVNRFKTCALQSFSCDYTPDGFWAAYEQGQPVSTVISMQFTELEPIFDTDYQQGNIFEGRYDLDSVSNQSVGY